mgnify:CR=1 FL=1
MEQNKLEELTYQIISLLKKWQLWDSIDIFCNGKFYSSYSGDGPLFSRPSTRGFRDLDDVWVGLSNQNGMDEYLSYYIDSPESDPVMYITCEGTALSDLLCGKRDSMSTFDIPYCDDKEQVEAFQKAFYSLFSQNGIHCLPLGQYYAMICVKEKGTLKIEYYL